MDRCRIVIGPDDARIYTPFSARDLIKDLPPRTRRWDKVLRCWITPVAFAGEVRGRLEDAGYDVAVINLNAKGMTA